MKKTKLTAYDKKTKQYVDSITTDNVEDLNFFRFDFKMCRITEE